MIDPTKVRLGEILIDRKMITKEQLNYALKEQKQTKEFLGAILVDMGVIEETDLLRLLSEQLSIPAIDLTTQYINWQLTKKFSASLVLDHKYLPIYDDDYSVTVATANPLDMWARKKAEDEAKYIKQMFGIEIKYVLASASGIESAITRYKDILKAK